MFPYGMSFGSGSGQPPELTPDSSKEDLWDEVTELRAKLKAAEDALELAAGAQALTGKPMLVVRGASTYKELEAIATAWKKCAPSGSVFGIPEGVQLQELDDDDLASIGLVRGNARGGPVTDRDHYERMLRGR